MADTSRSKPGTQRINSPNRKDRGDRARDGMEIRPDPTHMRVSDSYPVEDSPNRKSRGTRGSVVESQRERGFVHNESAAGGVSVTEVSAAKNRKHSVDWEQGPRGQTKE